LPLCCGTPSHRIAHFNVTEHPTPEWTLQQFREVISGEQACRFVLHDRDRIYSMELETAVKSMVVVLLQHNISGSSMILAMPNLGSVHHKYRLGKNGAED
jgi:hypothetical protein